MRTFILFSYTARRVAVCNHPECRRRVVELLLRSRAENIKRLEVELWAERRRQFFQKSGISDGKLPINFDDLNLN